MDLPIYEPRQRVRLHQNFIPCAKSKKRARLLSHKAFMLYSVLLMAFLTLFRVVIPTMAPGVLGYASNINVSDLLIESNKTREKYDREPLHLNPLLSVAAQKKADHMFEENYWAHVSPSGVTPWDFILSSGYDYEFAGENLAKNFNDSQQVVQAWYNSKSHRDNLLSAKYSEVGYAVVNGVLDGYETTLVVQMFGTPKGGVANAAYKPSVPKSAVAVSAPPVKSASTSALNTLQSPTSLPASSAVNLKEIESKATLLPATLGASLRSGLDISYLPKYILGTFVMFLILLLGVDIWYSKRKGIVKLNGHTFAHIIFLLFVLFSVWYVVSPGVIL